MNGYVTVVFNNSKDATIYTYMVPDNIDMKDIQRYVVVENYFYDARKNISPYTIAKVIGWYNTCPTNHRATKYIVDTIDGESYKYNRQIAMYRETSMQKMDNYFPFLGRCYGNACALYYNSCVINRYVFCP